MKLSIEVEIAPDEVALASELLATLRTITDQIKGAKPPVIKNTNEIVQSMVDKLGDATLHEQAAADICAALTNPSFGEPPAVAAQVLTALEGKVFNVDLVIQERSVAPFLQLLPKLPDPHKTKIRDGMIAKVLQHLTKKRPTNVDRTQFFGQAEAFAVLVMLDFVAVDGAAQTIERLLNKPDTRSAAVTMLGKTVELCHEKLVTKCNPTYLNGLRKALGKVTEEVFCYDVTWVNQSMGWIQEPAGSDTSSTASAVPLPTPSPVHPAHPVSTSQGMMPQPLPVPAAPVQPQGLISVNSLKGHSSTVFTMCCDAAHHNMITSEKDGLVIVWNAAGKEVHRVNEVAQHCVYAMDAHPCNNLLLMGGNTNDHGFLALFDTQNRWQTKAIVDRHDRSLISCLKWAGADNDSFVTGESSKNAAPSGASAELVCYYDISRASNLSQLQPVRTYMEHEQMVTCVTSCPSNSNLFVSGSHDMTLRVWDKRVERSVACIRAHTGMITSIDMVDNMLLSAGVDCVLGFWDLRSMVSTGEATSLCQMRFDGGPNNAILKVASTGAPAPNVAAVSTIERLHIVDFTHLSNPVSAAATTASDPNATPQPYHDVKWGVGAEGIPMLYAANVTSSVEVFQMV